VTSARTGLPGGRGHCPACRAALWAPPDELLGRQDCPRCGADLWVIEFSAGPVFIPRRPGQSLADLLVALAGQKIGISAAEMSEALESADALDLVELVMEVEEALR
jgi:hypothetical protein